MREKEETKGLAGQGKLVSVLNARVGRPCAHAFRAGETDAPGPKPVSYTHLTLPTKA